MLPWHRVATAMEFSSAAAVLLAALAASPARAAGPKIVAGPSLDAQCFVPWTEKTKFFQFAKKPGPYRVALANGFIGNTWRIQMIKTAKAYAATPEMQSQIKEFKIVSTGTDVAAQIAAMDNFINSGYDAIILQAVNPAAFTAVIKRANAAGVVIVPFDNVLDTDQVMMVNEDQTAIGTQSGEWLLKNLKSKTGTLLEVRGLAGNSVDRDRHLGFRKIVDAPGNKFEVVEVVGNWDDGTAQKAVADAVSVHKKFDGMFVQAGSTGAVRALMDAKHPMIPVAAADENGFRKLCADGAKTGLTCASIGQSPGLVAISMKAAVAALQGKVMPQMISVPIPQTSSPDFKPGETYFPDLTDNFFTTNDFPACGVDLKAKDIMARDEKNS